MIAVQHTRPLFCWFGLVIAFAEGKKFFFGLSRAYYILRVSVSISHRKNYLQLILVRIPHKSYVHPCVVILVHLTFVTLEQLY